MSEGPFPENWANAARWLLGGVFVFVAGFEGYVMLWDGRFLAGLTSVAIAFALTAILVRWKHLEAWAGAQFSEATKRTVTHPGTWLGTIGLVLLLIALSPFIEESAKSPWSLRIGLAVLAGSLLLVAAIAFLKIRDSAKARPFTPSSLRDGLYMADPRFTFTELETDRHSEFTMRVFNGSGREVEIASVSGQITFNAPNNTNPAYMGTLPTPALRADSVRQVSPLGEWFLIFAQRVPAPEAAKLLDMLEHDILILFTLNDLRIEVFARDEPGKVVPLSLWHGVSYRKTYGFGQIIAAGIQESMIANVELG